MRPVPLKNENVLLGNEMGEGLAVPLKIKTCAIRATKKQKSATGMRATKNKKVCDKLHIIKKGATGSRVTNTKKVCDTCY